MGGNDNSRVISSTMSPFAPSKFFDAEIYLSGTVMSLCYDRKKS